MKIILGSSSARRQQIMKDMGYDFDIVPAGIDEKAIRDSDPMKLTLALAKAKAEAIKVKLKEDAILVTADQVVYFEGRIIEKPNSKEEAYKVLADYGSKPIQTVNGVVVTNTKTGVQVAETDVSTIYFGSIPKENIEKFVESGQVFDHAGSFAAGDPKFYPYVKEIIGSIDSVNGLPKDLTKRLIEKVST